MAQLYFYYSAMNAGKTTILLQSNHNYQEQGMSTGLLTAKVDNRFEEGKIVSRIGLSQPASVFDAQTNLITWFHQQPQLDCVLVDEAQFLTRTQVDQLATIVDHHQVPVLCYGIRTDFKSELFPGSERLLAIADKLSEIKTLCHCGHKATMNARIDAQGRMIRSGNQIAIGGNDQYISLCRKHFLAGETLSSQTNKASHDSKKSTECSH